VVEGDDHCEAYTTIVWGGLLSRERYYAAEAGGVSVVSGTDELTTKANAAHLQRLYG
jgi:hypothetical protein